MLTKANMAVVLSLALLVVTTVAFSMQFKPHPTAAASVAGAGHHIARATPGGTDPLDPASRVVTKVVYDYPPGMPAIGPTLSVTTQSVAAYTQSAVDQYFATHQLFTPMSSTVGTVTKALFITAAQASALLRGESIGRPDTALVCYVEVQGPFSPGNMSMPAIALRLSPFRPAPLGIAVFDAQTGNLLLTGLGGY